MIIIETIARRSPPPIEKLVPTPIESGPTQEKSLAQEPEGFARTIQFIETALAEGARFNVPKRLSKEQWDRNLDITLIYVLSPDETLEDIGRIYGRITRERVRQIRDNTIGTLWVNALPETQSRFPFEELELNKPRPQKTKEVIVFSRDELESKSPHEKNEELLSNLKNAKTDKEKQHILDQIPYFFYLENTKGDDPLLMRVKEAIVKAGYHVRRPQDPSLFYEVIKTEEIPMVNIQRKTKVGSKEIVLSYHAILTEHEERAKNAWRKREYLQKFLISPVQQVAGPQQQGVPSVTLIEQRNRFRKLGTLFLEFGIVSSGQPTKKYRTLLLEKDNFPVPIYFYRHRGFFYPVEKDAELRSHTEQFLETLMTTSIKPI